MSRVNKKYIFLLLYLHHLQCNTYITYINQGTYTKYSTYIVRYVTLRCLPLLLKKVFTDFFLFKYYIFPFFLKNQSFSLLTCILLYLHHLNFLSFLGTHTHTYIHVPVKCTHLQYLWMPYIKIILNTSYMYKYVVQNNLQVNLASLNCAFLPQVRDISIN